MPVEVLLGIESAATHDRRCNSQFDHIGPHPVEGAHEEDFIVDGLLGLSIRRRYRIGKLGCGGDGLKEVLHSNWLSAIHDATILVSHRSPSLLRENLTCNCSVAQKKTLLRCCCKGHSLQRGEYSPVVLGAKAGESGRLVYSH